MAGIKPPAGFERQPLDIEKIPSGRRFGRIYASTFPDPLGFGKTASRFSDPRRRDATKRFGVLYLGETLKVCFLEAVLRDRRDGLVGDLPIEEKEIYARCYAEVETISDLSLVDLRDDHAIRMGVPTDVAKSSRQSLARSWALAFPRAPGASRRHHLSISPERPHEYSCLRACRPQAGAGPGCATDRRTRARRGHQ